LINTPAIFTTPSRSRPEPRPADGSGHEYLSAAGLELADGILDDGIAAVEALVSQTFADPLGRMPLLGWYILVGFEDLFDPFQKRADFRLSNRLGSLVAEGCCA